MKKKLGAILLAGVMACSVGAAFVMSGCVKPAPDFVMPEGGFDVNQKVTITFEHQMGSNLRDILDYHIAEFQKLYPNIEVKHTSQGDWDGLLGKITQEIQAGNQPNVSFCYSDHVASYNSAEAVQPLNGFLADGEFKDMTVLQVKLNEDGEPELDAEGKTQYEEVPLGLTQEEQDMYNPVYFKEGYAFDDGSKFYTLPWAKSTEMMFYNKNFFEDNKLEVPTTWDEMEAVCKKIREEIDPDAVPFGYDSEDNWFISMCEQQGSSYTSSTGKKFLFDNPENRAFVEKFKGWYEKGYFTTYELSGKKYGSDFFLAQTMYMSIGSTGGATYNVDLSGTSVPFEVGIAPVPQVDPNNTKLISQGPSVCIFKDSDPQKVLASWLFVKYFTTNPLYQLEVSQKNGYMPVLKSEVMEELPAYTAWLSKANGSNYLTAQAVKVGMEHEDHYFVSPAFDGSSKAREQVELLMQSALPGKTPIDKAFEDALKACTSRYGE